MSRKKAGHFFMKYPFFYVANYQGEKQVELDETTARHIVQVLRMKEGEWLHLTDGKGNLMTASIIETGKKSCSVEIKESVFQKQEAHKVCIAISLLKNPSRFEWFLEKATEIGVSEIIPLLCDRTEKEKFRFDRLHTICVSALLQSRQCNLPILHQPQQLDQFLSGNLNFDNKYIAHCETTSKTELVSIYSDKKHSGKSSLILIGPEGDFSEKEIELALQKDFIPVSLGNTRLRTETAGVVTAVLLKFG